MPMPRRLVISRNLVDGLLAARFVSLRRPVSVVPVSRPCRAAIRTMTSPGAPSGPACSQMSYPVRPYTPQYASWPYQPSDFARQDEAEDTRFYAPPRLVAHIDDNAIASLRKYYAASLPRRGKLLEICSSWISHLPEDMEEDAKLAAAEREKPQGHGASGAADGGGERASGSSAENPVISSLLTSSLRITGYGMNAAELQANPVLWRRVVKDLNADPHLDDSDSKNPASYDAAMCVVSIDYLTSPREVLTAVFNVLKPNSTIHLAISNRCFPTKAVARWLNVSEQQRLEMVGDYLWFSGFRDIEIVTVVGKEAPTKEGGVTSIAAWFAAANDPLWVVRGKKLSS